MDDIRLTPRERDYLHAHSPWSPEGVGTTWIDGAKIEKKFDALVELLEAEGEAWDRPTHYGGEENPFEPIKVIEFYNLNFNLGNVIKYVLRAGKKHSDLDDLKKAYTYIGFEIRRRERDEVEDR